MPRITLALDGTYSVEDTRALGLALCMTLAASNVPLVRSRKVPRLYASGVHWQREGNVPGVPEEWRNALAVLRAGEGDCEDLTAWRLAELWLDGEREAKPFLRLRRQFGRRRWHFLVQHASGQFEDPSRRLGM